jgi:hypothetical protein
MGRLRAEALNALIAIARSAAISPSKRRRKHSRRSLRYAVGSSVKAGNTELHVSDSASGRIRTGDPRISRGDSFRYSR